MKARRLVELGLVAHDDQAVEGRLCGDGLAGNLWLDEGLNGVLQLARGVVVLLGDTGGDT